MAPNYGYIAFFNDFFVAMTIYFSLIYELVSIIVDQLKLHHRLIYFASIVGVSILYNVQQLSPKYHDLAQYKFSFVNIARCRLLHFHFGTKWLDNRYHF